MKNLKLFSLYSIAFIAITLFFSSCSNEPTSFDETLLIGKWQSTTYKGEVCETYFYVYTDSINGHTWNIADDISEEEAQHFTWKLSNGNQLIQIHKGEMGQDIPKPYKITQLDQNTLCYTDENGVKNKNTYVFMKVN